MLEMLASGGMNVARLNMSHSTHEWHREVIDRIRKLNKYKGYSVAIMMDTEGGSEVHLSSVETLRSAQAGDELTLTIRAPTACSDTQLAVSFGGFVEDVEPGDMVMNSLNTKFAIAPLSIIIVTAHVPILRTPCIALLSPQVIVDGGMASMEVVSKSGPDVLCRVVDSGLILPRASITVRRRGILVRAKNALLPVISAKDWTDIDLAIEQKIDFIAVSFVKGADVLHNLRSYVASRSSRTIEIVSKIESFDSVPNLPAIVEASDAVMVARGDLGAQVPLEDVPSLQQEIVLRCRQRGKPVIVASQLLESMHTLPTPTRAEVADIADAVRQRADALMLSGESAIGSYPERALDVLRTVSTRMEEWVREEQFGKIALPQIASSSDGRVSEELCAAAASVANNLGARAIFCFTKRGYMANFLSRMRPEAPIYAFTDKQETRQGLNLRWGVIPFRLDFAADPETNIARTFSLLKRRELVDPGDLVVVVSDVRQEQAPESEAGIIRSVQVRRVP